MEGKEFEGVVKQIVQEVYFRATLRPSNRSFLQNLNWYPWVLTVGNIVLLFVVSQIKINQKWN